MSSRLLRLALPLVPSHGFTRAALAHSVLYLPPAEAHQNPLPDNAVSALFGHGTLAQKRLVIAWLKEGIRVIQALPPSSSLKDVLGARLQLNEPVLHHLPEAFALLASPPSGLPPLDPRPALQHAAEIADEACFISGDASLGIEWYARRATVAAMYTATELHQLTSPKTAYDFLESLLVGSSAAKSSLDEIGLFSSYVFKSCRGILKSSGLL